MICKLAHTNNKYVHYEYLKYMASLIPYSGIYLASQQIRLIPRLKAGLS
jgi:hypothetical protein